MDEISENELSLTDSDIVGKLKDILAAKYGIIALNEPILHTAVANAAALNFLISELNTFHKTRAFKAEESHEDFKNRIENTLLFFERQLTTTIQRSVTEVCQMQIKQFRIISEKQTSQIKHIIDNVSLPVSASTPIKPGTTTASVFSFRDAGFGILIGAVMALVAAYIVI